MFASEVRCRAMPRGRVAALLCAAVVGLASVAVGQNVVIGDFEDPGLDAWGTAGGPGSPVLSQSTIGATLGSSSLRSANPQGAFWGPTTGNLVTSFRNELAAAQQLRFDLTMIGTEINGGSGSFDGFAQSKELAVTLFAPSGLNIFAQRNSFGALTEISGLPAHNVGEWNGVDGTRTLIWNLRLVTAVDPADGLTKPVGDILANHPEITEAKIAIVQQFGGGTAPVGPGSFFFDNVVLVVPEPTSLALAAISLPALLIRRRS